MNEEDVTKPSTDTCRCFEIHHADWLEDATPVEVVTAALHVEGMAASHEEARAMAEEIIRLLLR